MRYILYADPTPQSRPRFSKKGFAYEDSYVKNYKSSIRIQLLSLRPKKITGPVSAKIEFFFSPLKTRKYEYPISSRNGDLDNLEKAIWDVCNEVLFEDDRLIISQYSSKKFISGLQKPCVIITLYPGFVEFKPDLEIQ